jgi:hypothetical protein
MHKAPKRRRVLCLNLTLKKPFNIPNAIAAMLEIVTIWLTIPKYMGSEEPKKVLAKSTKNKLDNTSSILVPKTTRAKEKINRLPSGLSVAELLIMYLKIKLNV